MKYIKLFENFSEGDWKQNILQNTEILNIVEDLRDLSAEYLDDKVEVTDEFDGETTSIDKSLIFDIMIQNKEGHLDSIVNGSFDYNQDKPIEDYFYWNEESIIPDDLMMIPDMIKSGELKLMVNFAIIFGAEDGDPDLTDDSGNVYQRIIIAYPDVEFDIIDPWDLN
jgi:hypothetical protein